MTPKTSLIPIGNSSISEINPNDSYLKNEEYPFIPMDAVRNGFCGVEYFERRKIDGSGLVSFKENDTIVAKITPCAENGKIAFIKSLPDKAEIGFGSTEFIVFRPNQTNVFPEFLYSVLSNHQVHGLAVSLMEGSTGRQRIPQKAYKKRIYAHFPPLPEQKAIAGILSKVDEAIEAVENSIKTADRLKKSLMQNLLTGKLKSDGTWRSEDEFYENDTNRPKSWNSEKFKKLIEYKSGYTWSKDQENSRFVDGSVRVLTVTNIQKKLDLRSELYLTQVTSKDRERKTASKGWSIAVSSNGNRKRIGNAVFINDDTDYLFASFLTGFIPKDPCIILPKYFFYWLSSHPIQERITSVSEGTTGLGNLDIRYLRNMDIDYPQNTHEQSMIVQIIEDIEQDIFAKAEKSRTLSILKKSLMQNLLTGKVRVDVEKINKLLEM